MRISKLIEELQKIKEKHGDIEVTCTGSSLRDSDHDDPIPNVFESTVHHLFVQTEKSHPSRSGTLGTRVRLNM